MDRRWQLKFWGLIGAFLGLAIGLAVVLATALNAARSIEDWNQALRADEDAWIEEREPFLLYR